MKVRYLKFSSPQRSPVSSIAWGSGQCVQAEARDGKVKEARGRPTDTAGTHTAAALVLATTAEFPNHSRGSKQNG